MYREVISAEGTAKEYRWLAELWARLCVCELVGVISCDEGLLESARLFPKLGCATRG